MDENITIIEFAKYRLERAKQDLSDAEFSYRHKRYLNANKIDVLFNISCN